MKLMQWGAGPAPLTKRYATILAALLLVVFVVGTWKGEHDSCVRQKGVRASSMVVAQTAAAARREDAKKADREGNRPLGDYYRTLAVQYDKAAAASAPLRCNRLLPEASNGTIETIPVVPPPVRPPDAR